MTETTRGRLIWLILLFALQLSRANGDFTSHHLHNYLNYSVSPCSDFHRHVCSIGMNPNETAVHKSMQYYSPAIVHALDRKNPIMNDIIFAAANIFDAESYKFNLRIRCGTQLNCYLEEFNYFFDLYKKSGYQYEDTLTFFASHATKTRKSISSIVSITSELIKEMTQDVDQDSFFETPWLNDTDSLGLDRLSEYLTTLKHMTIIPDFDKSDLNMTMWSRIDRIMTAKYFEHSKRSTGCVRFDVMHPFLTFTNAMLFDEVPGVTGVDYERMQSGLTYNAFNFINRDTIVINAPTFYPFMWANSSAVTQLAFGATMFGHEMFHSFIYSENVNEVYKEEEKCMKDKFEASCGIWAEGDCKSGKQTINEDGPDVEGMRVAYELLKETYSKEQLQEREYEDLEITREQAFFYAFAVRWCHANGDHFMEEHDDVHSATGIRVNGALALMPEFTAAFGCKPGDEEYSDESTSCYLFGPLAGAKRGESSNEETEDEESEEDTGEDEEEEYDEGDGSGEEETESNEEADTKDDTNTSN